MEFTGPYLGLRFSYYYNISPPEPLLAQPIRDIQRKLVRGPQGGQNSIVELENDIGGLTKLIDAKTLRPADDTVAHYYRAEARYLTNDVRVQEGLPLDPSIAQEALRDYDQVIASDADLSQNGVTIANTEFKAGAVQWFQMRSESNAYAYWNKCAEKGHGGCLFNVADGHLTGEGGEKLDLAQARDLYGKVFDMGKRYTCASVHSAERIAQMTYFIGLQRPVDNTLDWVHRSYELADEIEKLYAKKDWCGNAQTRIEEFLYRLDQGEARPELLTQATERLADDRLATNAAMAT
jgi:TPR repeat protein